MPGAEAVERYRLQACECVRIAQDVSDTRAKLALLEMAQSWLRLAEQAATLPEHQENDGQTVVPFKRA